MKKIILFLLLASCGFQPMYVNQDMDIYVAPISGINGIELRNNLNSKFGGQKAPDAAYSLTVNLKEPVTRYKGIEDTGDATWQEITLRAEYTLKYNGEVIAHGTETASESYSFVKYLVAANASYNSAVQNSIKVLAEKISMRTIAETHRNTSVYTKKE